MNPEDWLKAQAQAQGFDLAGITNVTAPESGAFLAAWLEAGMQGEMKFMERDAELRGDPERILPDARSALVVGLNYAQPIPVGQDQPKIARYAQGRDYHKLIRARLRAIARSAEGVLPGHEWRACTDSAPLFERELAHRAGLGWFGKNSCLIDSKRGSWFLIGVLLTTAELRPDRPALGGCGTCRKCIEACPTGAIQQLQGRWTVDARRCISALTIETKGEIDPDLANKFDGWTFGCDICQEVCPFNEPRPSQPLRAVTTQDPELRRKAPWPKLSEIAQWTREDWDRVTTGSATRRASLEQWTRNAEIARRSSGENGHNS